MKTGYGKIHLLSREQPKKKNLAKNMLKDGVNIGKIAKYTNLSEKYIATLR